MPRVIILATDRRELGRPMWALRERARGVLVPCRDPWKAKAFPSVGAATEWLRHYNEKMWKYFCFTPVEVP